MKDREVTVTVSISLLIWILFFMLLFGVVPKEITNENNVIANEVRE